MKNKYDGMSPKVESYQKGSSCYAQSFDQAPTRYIERNDREQSKAASKLKSQSYKGRY